MILLDLQTLLGSTVIAAVFSAIVKFWSDQRINDAQSAQSREMEILRSELETARTRAAFRFSKLHKRRLRCIEELWNAALEADAAFTALIFPPLVTPHTNDNARDRAFGAARRFDTAFRKGSLYFDDPTCDELWKFDKALLDLVHEYVAIFGPGGTQDAAGWQKLFKEFTDKIPPLKDQLRRLLSSMYGVEAVEMSTGEATIEKAVI